MPTQDGDVLEVTVIHDNDETGEQVNRYQYEVATAAPVSESVTLDDVALLMEGLYNFVKAIIVLHNVLREVKVFNVTQNALVGSTDAGTYSGGTAPTPAAPQGVAPYVHFVTGVPRVILSKYLPSGGVGTITGQGNLTVSALAQVASFGSFLLAEQFIATRGYSYGYLSPKTASFVKPQVVVAKNVYAYQRRRKKGRGS